MVSGNPRPYSNKYYSGGEIRGKTWVEHKVRKVNYLEEVEEACGTSGSVLKPLIFHTYLKLTNFVMAPFVFIL